jgi:hypothetical protein
MNIGYMWGRAVHDAMCETAEELAREMGVADARRRDVKTGPRYGTDETARITNALSAATRDCPGAYDAVQAMISHAYNQAGWIEKVWRGLARAAQEAER